MLAVALWAGAPVSTARAAPGGDIVIVAVDSSRVPSPDGPEAREPVVLPIGDTLDSAAGEINRHGGLLGRRLVVMRENDQCSADEAAAVAGRIVGRETSVVIGHVCSGGAIRAAAVYADAGILMIATGPRHPRLTGAAGRRGIHRLAGRDDRQADSIAGLLVSAYPAARVAIVHDQSLRGRTMADEVRRSIVVADLPPVLVVGYPTGVKDHTALVEQLVKANIDLVIFPSQPFEASMILDQARRAGARIETAIGTDVLAADAPPARLLAAVGEFLVMLPWPGSGAGGLSASGPIEATPAHLRNLARAAFELWTQAVDRAGNLAPDAVAAALQMPGRATKVGTVRFDDKGDAVVPSFVPHVWRDGRWRVRR